MTAATVTEWVRSFSAAPIPLKAGRRKSGGHPRRERPAQVPVVSNERIAILIVLAAESMFFAGLIGAFIVYKFGSVTWPPPFQPRLPLGVTWLNTIILEASALTVIAALRAVRQGDQARLLRGLAATTALGSTFLLVQGSEWLKLIGEGLTISSGTYGSTFYVLIGCHALHVAGAILWLGFVWDQARRGRYTKARHATLEICSVYWLFVCALWLVLFGLVY